MKHLYSDAPHWTTISLMEMSEGDSVEHGWLITGVGVQKRFRGQGYAADLLDRVCADADAEGAILYLEIRPDGTGLDEGVLARFYGSRGFEPWDPGGEFSRIRYPKKEAP